MFGLCRDITEDDAVVVSSNGQLTLTLVSKDHEGEWRCQATNSLGSGEARTKLTVTSVKGNTLNTLAHTHARMHTHTHTNTHTLHLSCARYKNSKSRATTLLGHTLYTDSGHGTAIWKPEDQCKCESSSSIHSTIAVYLPELSVLSVDGYL